MTALFDNEQSVVRVRTKTYKLFEPRVVLFLNN